MRSCDEEMTLSRKVYDMRSEIKSPEDIASAEYLLSNLVRISKCRTYDFNIASDMSLDKDVSA